MNREAAFRRAVSDLADFAITDDMVYWDSLPEKVNQELGAHFADLSQASGPDVPLKNMLWAAKSLEMVAPTVAYLLPPELSERLEAMVSAREALEGELGS